MCSETTEQTVFEDTKKSLSDLVNRMAHYHEHKEKATHAGLLVLLALVTAICGLEEWPPSWLPDFGLHQKTVGLLVALILWLPINAYIRQQHRMCRMASRYMDVSLQLQRHWIYMKPKDSDLQPCKNEPRIKYNNLSSIIDLLIFPIERIQLKASDGLVGYPEIMVARLMDASIVGRYGSGLLIGILSILGLVFLFLRTIYEKAEIHEVVRHVVGAT